MSNRKGFTLIEIVVVLIIIGILAVVAIPSYTSFIIQGASTAAKNNLITIYNGQKNDYLNSGAYYSSGGNTNDQTGINTALGLNIMDTNSHYTCTTGAGPSFSCTATNTSDSNLILTVTSGTPGVPNQIVLPGGASCASSTGANPGCNPSCQTDNTAYCPSQSA